MTTSVDTESTDDVVDECPGRPLRADAERNRKRILEAGARLFAERGVDATLNDVAHAAGVGVATVYRKFPDKNALLDALADHKLEVIRRLIDEVMANPDIGQAFRSYMLGAAEARSRDRGLIEVLFRARGEGSEVDDRILRLLHTVDDLIERAREAGIVRPEFGSADVDMFMLMVGTVADRTRDTAPDAWKRCAEILLDGFAGDGACSALSEMELDDATRRAIFVAN